MRPCEQDDVSVSVQRGYCAGRFRAMASPCEVLVDGEDLALAQRITRAVQDEALRIERKFSRYRDDSVTAALHRAAGARVAVDDETTRLLDYADTLFTLSDGAFDITSGVLRRAWVFDGSDRLPSADDVAAWHAHVGWRRVARDAGGVTLPAGMELDFGGIGKEYAVDRALALATGIARVPMLVNFGGDLATNGAAFPAETRRTWTVGVESPDGGVARHLQIPTGAMATSGDARRFLLKDGVRYGHILDARTGWPVAGAPRSVTVVARTCVEAGTLSTLAILRGAEAAGFLAGQDVQHWILW